MGGAEKRETCHTLPRWSDRATSHRAYKSHSSLIEKMCFKLSLLGVTKELDDINRSMGTLSWLNLELTVTRNRTPCGNTRHYIRTMCGVAYCKLLAAWSTCSPKVRGWNPGSGIFHVTPDFHFYTRTMIWDLSSKLLSWNYIILLYENIFGTGDRRSTSGKVSSASFGYCYRPRWFGTSSVHISSGRWARTVYNSI